jgi:hypothetical protein
MMPPFIDDDSSNLDFAPRFDFWDPTLSFHDDIMLGGMLDASLSNTASMHANELQVGGHSQGGFANICTNKDSDRASAQSQRSGFVCPNKISGVHSIEEESVLATPRSRILPGLFIAVNNSEAQGGFLGKVRTVEGIPPLLICIICRPEFYWGNTCLLYSGIARM